MFGRWGHSLVLCDATRRDLRFVDGPAEAECAEDMPQRVITLGADRDYSRRAVELNVTAKDPKRLTCSSKLPVESYRVIRSRGKSLHALF